MIREWAQYSKYFYSNVPFRGSDGASSHKKKIAKPFILSIYYIVCMYVRTGCNLDLLWHKIITKNGYYPVYVWVNAFVRVDNLLA